jgi:putative transcriptional regulator
VNPATRNSTQIQKLSTVLPDIKELDRRKETLYLGGPVEPTRILFLVKSANPPEASMPIFGDVYLSSSPKVLQRLIKKPVKEERFQIYAGYTGWAPKQLESECDRGHWHVMKADAETLFDKKSSEIWQELIDRISVKWVRTINFEKLLQQNNLRNPVLDPRIICRVKD